MGPGNLSLAEDSVYIMEKWCKEHGIPLTDEQVTAAAYCRSRQLQFLVDYGYGNVVATADALFTLECEKALELGLIQ